mgnify:CR=1 FL=1
MGMLVALTDYEVFKCVVGTKIALAYGFIIVFSISWGFVIFFHLTFKCENDLNFVILKDLSQNCFKIYVK